MNQLVIEQKSLSKTIPFPDETVVNHEAKILMRGITWKDIQGLSWIFKDDED